MPELWEAAMNGPILVPLDGSPFGEAALPLARTIARRAGVALHLVHVHVPVYATYVEGIPVIDDELDAELRQREQADLDALAQQFATKADRVTTTLLDGAIDTALAAHAAEIGAGVVVMTTHGRGGMARLWLGSNADGFVRHSHVPTLLLRPPTHGDAAPVTNITHMLITLDGSLTARGILQPALQLGAVFDANYTLLRVVDVPMRAYTPDVAHTLPTSSGARQEAEEAAAAYLDAIAEPLRREDRRVQTRVVASPHPAQAILQMAKDERVDTIALATHGHGGLQRLLLGSTADKVLRGSELPVLLYRPIVIE
jgi:nucleotide-binding universal stress UspA family protein